MEKLITENLQLVPIDGPLADSVTVPDTLNPEKFIEDVFKKNFLAFVHNAKNFYKKVLTEKNNKGVSLFPVNLEKQIEEDAIEMAVKLFIGYKQTGLLDEYNRPTEKYFERMSQNAG